MYKEAFAEFEKALVISPGTTLALSGLGYDDAVSGRRGEAQKVLESIERDLEGQVCPSVVQGHHLWGPWAEGQGIHRGGATCCGA
jgi:hypothetical protein